MWGKERKSKMQNNVERKNNSTIYNIRFANLTDLYDYLKSNPVVNKDVFWNQASLNSDTSHYGEPLETAIEYCIGGYNKGFDNFLESNIKLKATAKDLTDNRILSRTLYGGVPQPALVAAGVPDCMLRYERDTKTSVRNVYFNLGYRAGSSAGQIANRGLAALYVIQALEEKGEMINFRAFELSNGYDNDNNKEVVNIEINLKKPGDLFLDIEKCYYPMTSKEFLRRILFRVLESSEVKGKYWGGGYGQPATEGQIREMFNVKPHDLVIYEPVEMGIRGYNIYDDTVNFITSLGLEEEFDVEKIKSMRHK